MINWLNRHFMPHEGNEHQPHFLRSDNIQTLIAVLLISQVFFFIFTFFVIPNSKQVAAIIVSSLIEQTNQQREKIKLGILETNDTLKISAQLKADDMASRGYFAHNTPDGKDPWYFFHKANYEYQYAGENLAVNFIDSKDVTEAWMNSKTHRDNLLNEKYTQVGIATALGKYKGRDAIFVVQHFGKPMSATVSNIRIIKNPQNLLVKNEAGIKKVLGVSTEQSISLWSKIVASSKGFNNSVELAIGFLSLVALLLAVLVKIKVQHPIIIANGVVIISITIALIFINTIITQGII